jgi:UDP-2,3-diacylglucosamine hydrolase
VTKAYFLSDIHLSDSTSEDAQVLLRLLENLPAEGATHLFLVGDIFDLWVGSHDYFRDKFAPIVEAIRKLVQQGVEVHFFEGNHDFHLSRFWSEEVGAIVHSDAEIFDLAGQTVRIEHGDLINPQDHGYLFLRWLLRTPVLRFLSVNLPASMVRSIGERSSQASRHYTSTAKELPVEKIKSLIRSYAENVFRDDPFDLIISGHVHVHDDATFSAGGLEVRSVNLGSWYDERKIFVLTESSGEFRSLDIGVPR